MGASVSHDKASQHFLTLYFHGALAVAEIKLHQA
jgi:hypothetical protein